MAPHVKTDGVRREGTGRVYFLKWILLIIPVFFSLTGFGLRAGPSCSCKHGGPSELGQEAGNKTEGGGIAASSAYQLSRAEIGSSFSVGQSKSDAYQTNAVLGYFLSESGTLSDNYKTHHPMSRKFLDLPPALSVTASESALTTREKSPEPTE